MKYRKIIIISHMSDCMGKWCKCYILYSKVVNPSKARKKEVVRLKPHPNYLMLDINSVFFFLIGKRANELKAPKKVQSSMYTQKPKRPKTRQGEHSTMPYLEPNHSTGPKWTRNGLPKTPWPNLPKSTFINSFVIPICLMHNYSCRKYLKYLDS